MTQLPQKISVPGAIVEKVAEVRRRALKIQLGTALAVALAVLLSAMGMAMLIDWAAMLMDSPWRKVLTFAALAAGAATFAGWAYFAWRCHRRLDATASLIDRSLPPLEERWYTVTQLAAPEHARDVHPAMYRQVAEEASRWSPRIAAEKIVPLSSLSRALWGLTLVTVILALAAVFDSYRMSVLLRRFWAPGSMISATELHGVPGNLVVGRGESVEIEARVAGLPVTQAILQVEEETNAPQAITLLPTEEQSDLFSHRIRGVSTPLRYRFRAGDGQTGWYQIAVADRPQLDEVRLTITPPQYTGKSAEVIKKLPRRLTVLQGSQLQFAFKPKQALASAMLVLNEKQKEPLLAEDSGLYRWSTVVADDFAFSLHMAEQQYQLENLRPPICEVRAAADKPPVVKILSPKDEVAVQPGETVPISFTARDDVGIGAAELVVYDDSKIGESRELETIPIPLGDQAGADQVKATVDFDLSRYDLSDGVLLSYAIRVREDRGFSTPPHTPPAASLENAPPAPAEDASVAEAAASPIPETPASPVDAPASPEPTGASTPSADEELASSAQSVSPPSDAPTEVPASSVGDDNPSSASASTSSSVPQTSPNHGSSPQPAEANQDTLAESSESDRSPDLDSEDPDDDQSIASQKSTSDQTSSLDAQDGPSQMGTSDRQTVNADNEEDPQETQKSMADAAQQDSSKLASPAGNRNANSPSESQSASSDSSAMSPSPNRQSTNASDTGPAPQTSSSKKMRLKVDEWAGSYDTQQRQRLEMAIAPRLEELDQILAKAERLAREALDQADAAGQWQTALDRELRGAEEQTVAALDVVDQLEQESYDTVYAFVGLQLVDIAQVHVGPARRSFWKALQSEEDARQEPTRDGWQHVVRARELIAQLTERFERARQEYALADSVQEIKKMYEIFVEESMALMRPPGDGQSPYSRKMVEFELDDEYLERLREVLNMRNKMRAELAKILAEDPRLLRRFLDAQQNRSKVLRHELADLTETQRELNREVKAWASVEEKNRPQLAEILLQRHIDSAQELAVEAAELHDRFETWLPLDKKTEDADIQAADQLLQQIATATRELSEDGIQYVDQQSRAKKLVGVSEANQSEETDAKPVPDLQTAKQQLEAEQAETVEAILREAQNLSDRFTQLEVLLRQMSAREDQPRFQLFSVNRLVETRRMIDRAAAWILQLKQHQAGKFHRAAEVDQYELAKQTDSLAGKLSGVEQQLAALLQNQEGLLPESIAEKARAMLATLDEQTAPNQLAAVYALRRNQTERATARQVTALESLELAGKQYDEMIAEAIKELDKLPVQDPIASLLQDPTLDELLAELENEQPLEELLGIPRRPSNLRMVGSWMRPGGDNSLMTAASGQYWMNQMRQQNRTRQLQLDEAYRRAVARALDEATAEDLVQDSPEVATEITQWNRLVSQLEDDLQQGRDKAPPERYRRAIEQYFRQISGSKNE